MGETTLPLASHGSLNQPLGSGAHVYTVTMLALSLQWTMDEQDKCNPKCETRSGT